MHAERLKQQGRLFPLFIFEMLTSTRRLRVSGFLVALTQRTHSQRAIGVISFHRFWILRGAAARAAARSWGTLGSGHSLATWRSDRGKEVLLLADAHYSFFRKHKEAQGASPEEIDSLRFRDCYMFGTSTSEFYTSFLRLLYFFPQTPVLLSLTFFLSTCNAQRPAASQYYRKRGAAEEATSDPISASEFSPSKEFSRSRR